MHWWKKRWHFHKMSMCLLEYQTLCNCRKSNMSTNPWTKRKLHEEDSPVFRVNANGHVLNFGMFHVVDKTKPIPFEFNSMSCQFDIQEPCKSTFVKRVNNVHNRLSRDHVSHFKQPHCWLCSVFIFCISNNHEWQKTMDKRKNTLEIVERETHTIPETSVVSATWSVISSRAFSKMFSIASEIISLFCFTRTFCFLCKFFPK